MVGVGKNMIGKITLLKSSIIENRKLTAGQVVELSRIFNVYKAYSSKDGINIISYSLDRLLACWKATIDEKLVEKY